MEMAVGNFSKRVPLHGNDDELDLISLLVNWVAEELGASLFFAGYINPRDTYRYVVQSTFMLDSQSKITAYSMDVPAMLGYDPQALRGMPFERLLAEESVADWAQVKEEITKGTFRGTILPLRIRAADHLVSCFVCSILCLDNKQDVIITFFNANSESHQEQVRQREEVDHEPEKTYTVADARLMQSVYDYVLAHLDDGLPTLKKMARLFGTNEYKLKVDFRYFFGTTIYQFYNSERLERSYILICKTSIPLKNIAEMAGFSTYPNFSRAFKIKFGYGPAELQKKSRVPHGPA